MTRCLAALSASLVLSHAPIVAAQTFPSRPMVMVVPFAAGGPTDTLGRIMAERLGRALGGTMVVENTVGAAGSIGVGRVARAVPDGHTIGIGHWSTHVVNGAIYNLQYDLLKDFDPVAQIASNPQLLVSKNAVPARDLRELVAWVKANQDKVTVGTAGVGAASHVSGVYFQTATASRLQFVPYKGTGPALVDLMAGHIDLMFDQASNALPHVRAGKLRPYAVTAKSRIPAAPDVPTVDEAGLPGLYIAVWHALWLPRGAPREVVMKLNGAVVEALADPAVRKRLADMGQEIPAREQQTPEALGAWHRAEIEKWWPIIRAAGIKGE
ncbi:MAG: tripartite tricarboxylate transporter substrate binding protein BugD [Burkholderiales bacterium]|nr:tripartite tricarboxylate transporter substrate binding protein BugD [Burkholderiales bacterium]